MVSLPEPVKISTTTVAPEVKTSPSSVSVAQSVLHKLTETVTAAIAKAEKPVTDAAAAEEPKETVIESIQLPKQIPGHVFHLDDSQPLYDDDSHVFIYFMLAMLICALGYIIFHNKRKILALIIEGRQSHGDVRRAGGVNYKRLNTEPPGVSVA